MGRTLTIILFLIAILLAPSAVPAGDAPAATPVNQVWQIPQVPGAPASVLASLGFAVVVAAERRRRKLEKLQHSVDFVYYLFKRSLDICLAIPLILFASPLFIIIAALIKLDSPGPVFHKRRVIGRKSRSFDMLKFRSMVPDADSILERDHKLRALYNRNFKLDQDPRVTRIGSLLRKTSLDELPQLINILLGTMTFVGPRPIHSDEVILYGPNVEHFKKVKPGITGLWQTSGRSETSYERRVELDMMYIKRRCILMDLSIIVKTVPAVLTKRGAC